MQLRRVRFTRASHQARRRLGAGGVRRHAGAVHRERRGERAAVPARQGPGLDHRRVRHAAARHAHAHRARGGARQADRAHPGDPAPDRPLAARGRGPARRSASAPSRSTATCCRPTAARAPPPITGGYVALADACEQLRAAAPDRARARCTGRWRRSRSASSAACRCSTSTTTRTPQAETDMNVVMNNGGALRRGAGHRRGPRLPAPRARCAAQPRRRRHRRAVRAAGAGAASGRDCAVVLASSNPGKLREFAALLAPLRLRARRRRSSSASPAPTRPAAPSSTTRC